MPAVRHKNKYLTCNGWLRSGPGPAETGKGDGWAVNSYGSFRPSRGRTTAPASVKPHVEFLR